MTIIDCLRNYLSGKCVDIQCPNVWSEERVSGEVVNVNFLWPEYCDEAGSFEFEIKTKNGNVAKVEVEYNQDFTFIGYR